MKTQITHKTYRTVIAHVKASGIPEAPSDGRTYARRESQWYPLTDGADVSSDPDNRLTYGNDGGLYVQDDLTPDPLAYYIIARG